jgi:hypothetical protein
MKSLGLGNAEISVRWTRRLPGFGAYRLENLFSGLPCSSFNEANQSAPIMPRHSRFIEPIIDAKRWQTLNGHVIVDYSKEWQISSRPAKSDESSLFALGTFFGLIRWSRNPARNKCTVVSIQTILSNLR